MMLTSTKQTPLRLRSRSATLEEWLPVLLGAAFAVEFVALGWAPHARGDWLLENVIAVPVAVWLVVARRKLKLSVGAWLLVFLFLGLHEVGSHYTYSLVPWMDWSRDLLGWAPDWQRNHYDRMVHFAFGLLITRPFAELLSQPLPSSPKLRRLIAMCMILTSSVIYELLEWAAALVVEPEVGIAFVGAQGDIWDAQKDMGLALLGSSLATLAAWIASSPSGVRGDERPARD